MARLLKAGPFLGPFPVMGIALPPLALRANWYENRMQNAKCKMQN
jgi:hypothetical protein